MHSREDSVTCGPIMPQGGIQALEAMLYTLDRLNSDPDFMPNVTLGAHILDDCDKDTYGLEMAVDFIKGEYFVNNIKIFREIVVKIFFMNSKKNSKKFRIIVIKQYVFSWFLTKKKIEQRHLLKIFHSAKLSLVFLNVENEPFSRTHVHNLAQNFVYRWYLNLYFKTLNENFSFSHQVKYFNSNINQFIFVDELIYRIKFKKSTFPWKNIRKFIFHKNKKISNFSFTRLGTVQSEPFIIIPWMWKLKRLFGNFHPVGSAPDMHRHRKIGKRFGLSAARIHVEMNNTVLFSL